MNNLIKENENTLKFIQAFYDNPYKTNEEIGKSKIKNTDTISNIINSQMSRDIIQTHSLMIDETLTMFERLKYDQLQGSSLQKHGDAAEVIHVAKSNKDFIKEGSSNRMSLSSSKTDSVTDTVTRNAENQVVDTAQLKYYRDSKSTLKSISQERYNANTSKVVPPEQYEEIKRLANEKAKLLKKEAQQLKQEGQFQMAEKKAQESRNYEHTAKTVKPGKLSYKESTSASRSERSRLTTTAKEIHIDGHEAGKNSAKAGLAISGTISSISNFSQVINSEKELTDALIDTAYDTGKGAAMAYGMSYGSTLIQSGSKKVAEKTGSTVLSNFSKTSKGPALLVTTTAEVTKSLKCYIDGDLTEGQLVLELGEKGTGIVGAEIGASLGVTIGTSVGTLIGGILGTFTVPGLGTVGGAVTGASIGATAGSLIGSMVGYMIGTQLYQAVQNILGSSEGEKYRQMKMMSDKIYERMYRDRMELEKLVAEHFQERKSFFMNTFDEMEKAVLSNNVEKLNEQLVITTEAFENSLQFKDFTSFNNAMEDDDFILHL